ncbi:MAG: carbon storage regulator [Planctomycetaceae bacterium]
MLVLTRKEAETITIGDGIVLKVIQTSRGTVKIGIDAPAEVRILRGELSAELAALPQGETLADRIKRQKMLLSRTVDARTTGAV